MVLAPCKIWRLWRKSFWCQNGAKKSCTLFKYREGGRTVDSGHAAGKYKKIEPDCRQGVKAQLERMKELCKERNDLYDKQNDLKGQKQKIEKSLER